MPLGHARGIYLYDMDCLESNKLNIKEASKKIGYFNWGAPVITVLLAPSSFILVFFFFK